MDDYCTLSAIYDVVRKAYAKRVQVDRAFQKKTRELVQQHVGTDYIRPVTEVLEINEETVEYIVSKKGGDGSKIINLVKSIERKAEADSDDPYLIAMADRARLVQESFENR
jgi:type I restriction enzyme R subunit